MTERLSEIQLNLMVALTGACAAISVFVLIAKNIPKTRRITLMLLGASSMLLLFFDRLAYIYSGSTDDSGYIMVRFTNYMVYTLTLVVIMALNLYLSDLVINEAGLKVLPKRLKAANVLSILGIVMVVISQFTGMYYYFDDSNVYHRGPGFILCYLFPLLSPPLQLTVLIQFRKRFTKRTFLALLHFITLPVFASFIQLFVYGLSLTNITIVCVSILVYISALYDIDIKMQRLNKLEIEFLQEERKSMHRLFDQTASAFINAVEERSDSTAGHSARVAEYAEMIARAIGKNEKDCEEIYFAGLLHDIGKIGIPESIIDKDGKLTSEEQKVLEQIPVIGDRILSSITEYPFLCSAARSVNERYDGLGYPDGLKGEEIPEAARIVAVADHYATMTSVQYDRSPYPRLAVREELIENSGTLFDPRFARIMVNLIDNDPEYLMQDSGTEISSEPETEITSADYRSKISRGILIEQALTEISFTCRPLSEKNEFSSPSLIIFDSYDRRTHFDEESIRIFNYLEYGEIWPDGHIICTAARNMESNVTEKDDGGENSDRNDSYLVTAGRFEDHAKIVIESRTKKAEVIIALQDSSKYAYIGITGENCQIENIKTEKKNTELWAGDIPRIAPKVVYTDRLTGDIPNIQIDSTRSETTEGIPLNGRLKVEFHAMSLPSSAQTWHCPYIILFYSEDGRVNGPDYREYTMLKLNGEISGDDDIGFNSLEVNKENFNGWDRWRQISMEGAECTALFRIKNSTVITAVTYAGLCLENTTDIYDCPEKLYVALSGDQCALTDIRIH